MGSHTQIAEPDGKHETTSQLTSRDGRWLRVFQAIEELKLLNVESTKDVDSIEQLLRIQIDSQVVRRTLVRNFAAHVEGFIYMLKQVTLALSHSSRASFTKMDLARLEESKSYLDADGQEKKLIFDRFLDNLKFAFEIYARVNGSEFKLNYKDNRYQHFTEMVQIRDRLMHPKSLKSFTVASDEMIRIGKARAWFSEQASGLLNSHAATGQFKSKFLQIPAS